MSSLRRIGLAVAAPVLAFVLAGLVTTAILLASGNPATAFWEVILSWPASRNLVNILNTASVLYLAGLAAAIGFRMNLFNIGVEGQYRVATFAAAVFAAQSWLPGYLNTFATVVVAMAAGAVWAGIAGLLRVTRGVSEVISTIMLNAIAIALVAYLLQQVGSVQGQTRVTGDIQESSRVASIPILPDAVNQFYGLGLLAVLAGIAYAVVINRTRFGFDLRATGASQTVAVASGVNVKRMVVTTMLLSGAIAGLIGMPTLFGLSYNYGSTIQVGVGFTGIAVALLGRNNAWGIAVGAVVFAFLTEQGTRLNVVARVSADIVEVMQGVVVLSVVIVYEVVRRYRIRMEQQDVARRLAASRPTVREVPA
ncbi:MAG: ABC transporter permease [Actinomycetota bacterium]|nr:ABC transporter permease [Actinomycetota bacterium]